MARKRTPSPEQQRSDRQTAAAMAQILEPLVDRYPAQLTAVMSLLNTFISSKVEQPVKRKASMRRAIVDAVAAQTAENVQ